MTAKYFITHSWKDVGFARRLTDDLRKVGLDGFFDAHSVNPGDDIVASINKGLKECDVYLPILSFEALKSPWCEEEIDAAIMLSKRPRREGRPRVIPILIEDCIDDLPPLLQHRLHVNFCEDYEAALNELLVKGLGIDMQQLPKHDEQRKSDVNIAKDTNRKITQPHLGRKTLLEDIVTSLGEHFPIILKGTSMIGAIVLASIFLQYIWSDSELNIEIRLIYLFPGLIILDFLQAIIRWIFSRPHPLRGQVVIAELRPDESEFWIIWKKLFPGSNFVCYVNGWVWEGLIPCYRQDLPKKLGLRRIDIRSMSEEDSLEGKVRVSLLTVRGKLREYVLRREEGPEGSIEFEMGHFIYLR